MYRLAICVGNLNSYLFLVALTAKIRSVLELRAFITEVVNNFEFSLTKKSERIQREACGIMVPTVGQGEMEKGSQLPLRVAIASRG